MMHPILIYCFISWWFFFWMFVQAAFSHREPSEKGIFFGLFLLAPIALIATIGLAVHAFLFKEKMKTFVFLDDLRGPWGPEWHHVKTHDECIEALKSGTVEHLSLDHDLSELHYNGELGAEKTGYHVVLWMAEFDIWPTKTLIIHTMNPSGRERMLQTAKRYAPESLNIEVQVPTKDMNGYTAYEEVLRLTGRSKKEE